VDHLADANAIERRIVVKGNRYAIKLCNQGVTAMQSMMAAETLVENAVSHAPAVDLGDSEHIGERRH
jgi:hypothetical protein